MGDGAEKPVHSTDHVVQDIGNIVEGIDEERVEIQRLKHAVDNIHEITKTNDELQFSFHVCDREVDFLDADLHAGIDLNQIRNSGVEVNVGLEVFYVCTNALALSSMAGA